MAKDPSSKRAHNFKDLTGQRFNRLIVIRLAGVYESPSGTRRAAWICQCDCFKITIVRTVNLTSGEVKSCGCLRNETSSKVNFKHGLTQSTEYLTWQNMMRRCYEVSNPSFQHYGGRGIKVCERWHNFANFFSDMNIKPAPVFTIERVDNNGNYEPNNCVWATREKQGRNRRTNYLVTFNGHIKTLAEWSESIDINYKTLQSRLKRYNWSIEKALTKVVRKIKSSGKLSRSSLE